MSHIVFLRTFRQLTWQHLCPLRYDRSYRFLLGLSVPLAAAPFELAALSRSAAEHGDESQNKPVEQTIGCPSGHSRHTKQRLLRAHAEAGP